MFCTGSFYFFEYVKFPGIIPFLEIIPGIFL
nr:MAG TPA: hypothetical protein [Caudoviricetes sp.]